MRFILSSFLLGGFLFSSSLLITSCSPLHSLDDGAGFASQESVSTESLEAFSKTMYAFGQAQGCVNCHGSNVNPQWMNEDLNLGYQFARPLVDFVNPTVSVFANYAGNNHCSNSICANPANIPVVRNLLLEWAAVEIQEGTAVTGSTLANPPFVTQTLSIPNPLPLLTASKPGVLRFDLSQVTPPVPSLNGAILEVSIQSYNSAQTEYKIFNPRIGGNLVPITVTGIHVYIRPSTDTGIGIEDALQGDLWAGLNSVVAVQSLPTPLPAGPMTTIKSLVNYSLGIASQSPADMITIGFADIK